MNNKSKTYPLSFNSKKKESIMTKTNNNDNYTSLCIPCVDMNIKKNDILKSFITLNIAYIDRIDEVYNHKQHIKRIFIHIKYWYNNRETINFKNNMKKIGHVNIIYSFPLFWKCYISNVNKP